MAKEPFDPRPPDGNMIRRSSLELHDALLHLHKVLLDSERAVYEATVGPIHSPNHFFQMLTGDPWFAWLRSILQLNAMLASGGFEPQFGLTGNHRMTSSFLFIPQVRANG